MNECYYNNLQKYDRRVYVVFILESPKHLTHYIMKLLFTSDKYFENCYTGQLYSPFINTFDSSCCHFILWCLNNTTFIYPLSWLPSDENKPVLVYYVHCFSFNDISSKKHFEDSKSKTEHVFLKIALIMK